MAPQPVLLDTDIGSDVDDCLALALILASPELELLGVTTVYGDANLRARMALKLLALHGGPVPPVAAGAGAPLLGKRPVSWAGYEGQGLLEPADAALQPADGHAVDLITRTVMGRPHEVTLIAIGPLTNVALALRYEPRLAQNLAGLTVMGGVVGGAYRQAVPWAAPGPYSALALPWTEHNFRSDPEAAHIVLSAGAALRIVPLDVTSQVRLGGDDLARIRAAGDPYHLAVAGQIERYPRFASRGWTYLHDPLAVATVIDPTLVEFQPVRAVVETGGEHTPGELLAALPAPDAPATAEIALAVDAPRSERFIVDRLATT